MPLVAWLVGTLVPALSRLFASRLGQWLVSALAFLGLSFATQHYAVGPLRNLIASILGGAGEDAVHWLAFLNVDKAITIILSAHAVSAVGRLALRRKVMP